MVPNSGYTDRERQRVEKALKAALQSEGFAGSVQLSDFLTFIVKKTLDGQEADIKAYTIAVDALGRDEDFDPQSNAAVRVAAGRLRQTLALYNAQEAPEGIETRIVLAPGSYVPTFEPIDELVVTDAPNQVEKRPSDTEPVERALQSTVSDPGRAKAKRWSTKSLIIAGAATCAIVFAVIGYSTFNKAKFPDSDTPSRQIVQQHANAQPVIGFVMETGSQDYPSWFEFNEVRDSIALAMARFNDYRFDGLIASGEADKLDYLLTVKAYGRGTDVRLFGVLTGKPDDRVLWSIERNFTEPASLTDRDLPAIAGTVFAAVGSPYGVIYSDLLRQDSARDNLTCYTKAYQYFSRESDEAHAAARDCAEELIESGSTLPAIHALLTFLYLDEIRDNRNRRARNPLVAAEKMALRAVELGPQSPRAHQSLFAVRKVQRRFAEARKSAELAIRLNPYDTDILTDYAAWLISVGDIGKGRLLLDRAQNLLAVHPAWLEVYRYLVHDLAGNEHDANVIASSMDFTRSPMTAASVAVSAARQKQWDRARLALDELRKSSPKMLSDPLANYIVRGFADEVANNLADKLNETVKMVDAETQ